MKFNIEVELDYIEEDGTLDEAIKTSILSKITKIVMEKVEKEIDSKLNDIVVKAAEKKAGQIVNRITNDFINRKFNKIDRYGDTIETGLTVKELLKKQFDDFWSMIVDKNGKAKDSWGSGPYKSRIEWKIDVLIEAYSKEFAEKLTHDTTNKIKASMKESLQNSIGAKLVNELGFDDLLMKSKQLPG